MSGKKQPPPPPSGPAAVAAYFLQGPGRRLLGIAAVLAALSYGSYQAWWKIRPHVLQSEEFRLTADKLVVSPQPPWIRTDVKAEIIRDGGLDRNLSLLDERLVERVHAAFSLHPWVENVQQVTKSYPARVEVVLTYRQPVAMVEVSGGLLPIDRLGFVLPSEEFSPLEASRFPRVGGIAGGPRGPIGTRWGDERVVEGAAIALVLLEDWGRLGLVRIQPTSSPTVVAARSAEYELFTKGGGRIPWGKAVTQPGGVEPTAAEKLIRLKAYADLHGSLANIQDGQTLDLRCRDQVSLRQ